ncbi:MAG: hypothetical protein QXT20_02655 [Candidatus Woesearchaeota archaeon]
MIKKSCRRGAGPSDTITLVFSLILYVVMVLVFSLLLFGKGCENEEELKSTSTWIAIENFLRGYLRSNVIVDGREISVAELISYYYHSPKDYKQILEKISREKMNESSVSCLVIKITFSDDPDEQKTFRSWKMDRAECTTEETTVDPSTGILMPSFAGRRQPIPIMNSSAVALVEVGVLRSG